MFRPGSWRICTFALVRRLPEQASKTTIWRVLTDADADAFDAAAGRWLMGLARPGSVPGAGSCGDSPALMRVRLDGMTIRGAKGNQMHPLAALAGPDAATSVVAAQAEAAHSQARRTAMLH
jgi:hypothetical protein